MLFYYKPALVVVLVAISSKPSLRAEENIDRDMETSWRKRQEVIQDIKITWEIKRTDMKAVFSTVFPPEDTSFSYKEELRMNADHEFYSRHGQTWDFTGDVPKLAFWHCERSFNKSDSMGASYLSNGSRSDGAIGKRKVSGVRGLLNTEPIFLFASPIDNGIVDIPTSRARLTEKGLITFFDKARKTQFWVDSALDYAVVRYERRFPSGDIRSHTTIDYQHDDEHDLFVPSTWKVESYSRENESKCVHSCRVVQYIVNSSLLRDDFKVTFPKGTTVVDQTKRTAITVN